MCYGKAKKETSPGAHRQKLPPSTPSRHAERDHTRPCSTTSICLAADPVSGVHAPSAVGLVAHRDRALPLQPRYAGLFAESLSEKSPPQSGHPSSPLLSSFCCFFLSFAHVDSIGARLFLPFLLGTACSLHLTSSQELAGPPSVTHVEWHPRLPLMSRSLV